MRRTRLDRACRNLALAVLAGSTLLGTASAPGADDPPQNAKVSQNGQFQPVPLPDPKIPGFTFPEKEETILGWVRKNDTAAINAHAWGIWTALTSPSGEHYDGQELLVFETWYTPGDLLDLSSGRPRGSIRRDPRPLTLLRQLSRSPRSTAVIRAGDSTVTGFVKYDPEGAHHILDNHLLSANQLGKLLGQGAKDVPAFPNPSISLKPVFMTLPHSKLVGGRYFMLPAWPGPPATPQPFGPGAWKQCVWVDTQAEGDGPGTGKVDLVCKADGSSRTPETTYGIDRFIHFRLSPNQAAALNAVHAALPALRGPRAAEQDLTILVAMHVTSRETTRWTWQTFWWTPTPDSPHPPSSKAIAADRPSQLKGAPRNYAVAHSYSMVSPPQPNTGGSNVGNSVYAYNPWLEAGFGPEDLPKSKPGTFNGRPVSNNVGVQTNCMSCHAQACYSTAGLLDPAYYTGDQYIDLAGPQFNGNLRVDFLWSIPDNAK